MPAPPSPNPIPRRTEIGVYSDAEPLPRCSIPLSLGNEKRAPQARFSLSSQVWWDRQLRQSQVAATAPDP